MICPLISGPWIPQSYVNVPAVVNLIGGVKGVPGGAVPASALVMMNVAFGLVPTTECRVPSDSSFIHWTESQTWIERTCPFPLLRVIADAAKSHGSVWTVPAPAAHVPAPPLLLLAAVALLLAAVPLLLAAVVLLELLLVAPPLLPGPVGVELLEPQAPTEALAPTAKIEARTSACRMPAFMAPLHVDRNCDPPWRRHDCEGTLQRVTVPT